MTRAATDVGMTMRTQRLMGLGLVAAGVVLGALAAPWLSGGEAHAQPAAATPAPAAAVAAVPGAVEYNLYVPPANPTAEKVVQKLDALGAQGWRLVSTTTSNGGTSGFIFMRERR